MGNVVKGALNFAKNLRGNVPKIIVPKPIEGSKEPRGDRGSVPARRSKERRRRSASRNRIKGVKESAPPLTPARKGNPGGPKHGSTVDSSNRPKGKKAKLFKLKGAMNAICIMGNFKYHGNGPGLEFQKMGGNPK